MKIKEMTPDQLEDAIRYMASAPKHDNCFSGFNFDPADWRLKFIELLDEVVERNGLEKREE